MTRPPQRTPGRQPNHEDATDKLGHELLSAAFAGRTDDATRAIRKGAAVDTRHPETGLTALHIAVGTNNLELARLLAEKYSAPFGPDAFGRWPTTVAAECSAAFEIQNYIVDAESKFLENPGYLMQDPTRQP